MSAESCLKWITDQQNGLETADYGRNERAIADAIDTQRTKNKRMDDYRSEIDRTPINDEKQKQVVERAYNNLQVIAAKRLGCLETMSEVVKLENLFASLSKEFSDKATQVTADQTTRKDPTTTTGLYDGCIANSSQGCILAMRDAWSWLGKLTKCSEIHLQNAADYQQFFHEIREYSQWMPVELTRAEELLNSQSLKRNAQGEDAARLLMEMKTALTMFLHWRGKALAVFERSRKIVPVQLRGRKLEHSRPALALASYQTGQINIKEGEEVTLLDNTKSNTWQVRNLRAQEADVPSTILLIPGPDPGAIEAALRLCLQYLSTWTNMVKRIGSTLILFLLQVIREWTKDEEEMLRALSTADKQEVLHLFNSIEQTFSPYWDDYPPYKRLRQRMDRTRGILGQNPDPNSKGSNGQLLVIQTRLLEELLARFRDFWTNWEKYKVIIETSRHPEYLLVAKSWEDYAFINTDQWIKKYGATMNGLDDVDWESLGSLQGEDPTGVDPDEIYTMERAKETAETSQITQSEQEEKQTFVITAVIDPRTGEEISLDQAIALRVINQSEGKYVNPSTGETMPIPMAMNAGKIKVELMTVKKSEEKKRDIGLVTIKTYKESRPYVIKGVIDALTDKQLTVDEAVRAGILDQKKGVYRNKTTKEELTLADALDSGLLIVEFESDPDHQFEPEVQTKTYAVHGVIDMKAKKRLTYQEAVQAGIVNQDTGEYYNNVTGEHLYVGDAIKNGHIRATVVKDPKQIDIAAGGPVVLADSAMAGLRHKMLLQSNAVNALRGRPAAGSNGAVANGK